VGGATAQLQGEMTQFRQKSRISSVMLVTAYPKESICHSSSSFLLLEREMIRTLKSALALGEAKFQRLTP
jgi:hypothetical protein